MTKKSTDNRLRIFSHDPGSRNYGYAIVEGRLVNDRVKFRVLVNGLCPCPINDLKDHQTRQRQRSEYLKWVKYMVMTYSPRGIYGERYMTRGIRGPTIESVNMMLGLLQSLELKDAFVPAAVWKNAVNRQGIDLKAEYKLCRTAPHQLDASLIGVYAIHQAFGVQDYGTMGQKRFHRLVDQIEETSTAKLYNRKNKR
jgi:hypothetical protein